jgi:tetratricopeptide (TPR) repeat protein
MKVRRGEDRRQMTEDRRQIAVETTFNEKFLEVQKPFFKKVFGRRRQSGSRFRIILFLLAIIVAMCNLFSQKKDYTEKWSYDHDSYIEKEGKNDPRVKWAFKVFEKVKRVADKAEARIPRLEIINTRIGGIYARSLTDGGIIIDPNTLDICYRGLGREQGDSRLAFILGHELAHLANKEFIHQEAFAALQKYGNQNIKKKLARYFKLECVERSRVLRKRELLADQKGVLYASMAGYDVGKLFWQDKNFFTYWAKQTGIGMLYDKSPQHPSFKKRLEFIRTQLQAVVNDLELFNAGVLLYQLENYQDAAAAFKEFSKAYPGREVLSNMGACYLNRALHRLHIYFGDDYYRFRLSTTIDYATTAVKMKSKGEGDYLTEDSDIARYIDRAVDYLKQAVAMDEQDRASRCNLAAALILKKEYLQALCACETIIKKHPQDAAALNNQAIAFYYFGKKEGLDTTQKALKILEKAHHLYPGNFEVFYNLVSLKEDKKQLPGANRGWEEYLALKTVPRDNFYNYVYKKLKGKYPAATAGNAALPQIPEGIIMGENFSRLAKKWPKAYTRKYKLATRKTHERWSVDLQVLIKDNIRVLAFSDMIEIVEEEFENPIKIENFPMKFGIPQKVVHHSKGNFYVYKDRGFSIKEIDGKIYSYIWYGKGF